jgi:hypothetical protein
VNGCPSNCRDSSSNVMSDSTRNMTELSRGNKNTIRIGAEQSEAEYLIALTEPRAAPSPDDLSREIEPRNDWPTNITKSTFVESPTDRHVSVIHREITCLDDDVIVGIDRGT